LEVWIKWASSEPARTSSQAKINIRHCFTIG